MKKLLDILKNKKENRLVLSCFSPLVMIITFTLEILLAIYAFIKSRKANSDTGIVIILVFLAVFQLAEYQICEGSYPLFWSRLGLLVITFLPMFGLYLVFKLRKSSNILKYGFTIAIAFAIFFVFVPKSITGTTCGGNYIIFDIESGVHNLYGYYYMGFLLLGIWQAALGVKTPENKKEIKKALTWFIIGYLSFILPLTLVYIVFPITRIAVASIMCGFAVVFAFILTFKVGPIYHKNVKQNKKV